MKPQSGNTFTLLGLAFQASAYRGSKILHLSTSKKASKDIYKLWRKFLKENQIEAKSKDRVTRFPNGSIVEFQGAEE